MGEGWGRKVGSQMMASSPALDGGGTPSASSHDRVAVAREVRSLAVAVADPLPVVTVEEIDAPHIASLVEQYHGPWRNANRGAAHHAARYGNRFTQVNSCVPTNLATVTVSLFFFQSTENI